MRRKWLIVTGLLWGLPWGGVVLAENAETPAPPDKSAASQPANRQEPARTGLNEVRGTLLAKSDDPRTLRLTVEGGGSVEFAYDSKTTFVNGGHPVAVGDLNYGDAILIHYAGKELTAIDVERVSKAPPTH